MSSLIVAQLLFLQSESTRNPIHMYINSPGVYQCRSQDFFAMIWISHMILNKRWRCLWYIYCMYAPTNMGKHCLQLVLTLLPVFSPYALRFSEQTDEKNPCWAVFNTFKMVHTTNACLLRTRLVSYADFWAHEQDTRQHYYATLLCNVYVLYQDMCRIVKKCIIAVLVMTSICSLYNHIHNHASDQTAFHFFVFSLFCFLLFFLVRCYQGLLNWWFEPTIQFP